MENHGKLRKCGSRTMSSKSQYHPIQTTDNGAVQYNESSTSNERSHANDENDGEGNIAMQSLELQQAEEDADISQNTRSLRSTLLLTACLLATLVLMGIVGREDGTDGTDVTLPTTQRESNLNGLPENSANETSSTTSSNFDIKQAQINNYIQGSALIWSIHITHHAGTSICRMMKRFGPSPEFGCVRPEKGYEPNSNNNSNSQDVWPPDVPVDNWKSWTYNETAKMVTTFRPYFHYMSREYRTWGNLHRTNWEYENLVSMIVMRDPIERFLARGKPGPYHDLIDGDPTPETMDVYWDYARSDRSDNYALRVLTEENNCVNGSDTPLSCLESAKSLLNRMTFILDEACLAESMVALGKQLDLDVTVREFENGLHYDHPLSTRERIGNDTLYEYLQNKLRRDIELYEWSKTQSIVQCQPLL